MSKTNKADDWRLDEIKLEFRTWGDDKGKYVGTIRFQNGDHESFKFKIRPNMAEPYIALMADDIVRCAESLGQRLVESLRLREADND